MHQSSVSLSFFPDFTADDDEVIIEHCSQTISLSPFQAALHSGNDFDLIQNDERKQILIAPESERFRFPPEKRFHRG
jgi:hypothetical protein